MGRWRESGLSAPEFAEPRGLDPQQLRWWAWRLRSDSSPASDAHAGASKLAQATAAVSFVELPIVRDERLELTLTGKRTLMFSETIDPRRLAALINVIEEAS